MTILRSCDIVEGMDKPKRKRAPSREGMVVTTIALPKRMHDQLRRLALSESTVFTQLVREALREWLERRKGGQS